jgi:hypothetical protein
MNTLGRRWIELAQECVKMADFAKIMGVEPSAYVTDR